MNINLDFQPIEVEIKNTNNNVFFSYIRYLKPTLIR